MAQCCQISRVTEEAYVAETAVWPIPFLINMFSALKRSQFYLNLPHYNLFYRLKSLLTFDLNNDMERFYGQYFKKSFDNYFFKPITLSFVFQYLTNC